MQRHLKDLRSSYSSCKEACQKDWGGDSAGRALKNFVKIALLFLERECIEKSLVSKVSGKQYKGYRRKNSPDGISRPVNEALFICDAKTVTTKWRDWIDGKLPLNEIAKLSYTACLAPCLALELFDRQNKKGPATFFECMIGHVFARNFGCNPQKAVSLEVEGTKARLTMDFLFHPSGKNRVHMPVKMSTRERVVQAWAHQRILDSAYGVGKYKGIMILFGETKLDSRSLEVVEICVPDQWLVYQSLISRMERIYYFDAPDRYLELTARHSHLIQIKAFPEFFAEKAEVLEN